MSYMYIIGKNDKNIHKAMFKKSAKGIKMENTKNENYIPPKAKDMEDKLKWQLSDTCELNITHMKAGMLIISIEGMAGSLMISDMLCEPVASAAAEELSGEELIDEIYYSRLLVSDKSFVTTLDEVIHLLFSGFSVIYAQGCSKVIAVGTQGFASRSVSTPISDQTVYGPQEGFTESIRVNISMIRRKMKTPDLTFEMMQTGRLSGTDVAIAYVRGKAEDEAVKKLRGRLKGVKLESVLSCGYLRPYIEKEYSLTLFSPSKLSERPDTVAAALTCGRIAVLTDGTPFVIIIPAFFSDNFYTPDDYIQKPIYVTFIRWLKYLAFFLATLFPGLYAAAVFEPQGFAFKLLLNLYSAEESSQFPLGVEVIIITVLLEILKEAGIRLPKAVGSAVSIVGGLIIGDAAVKCGIISAPLLILVGLTATSSFVIPEISAQTSVMRFAFILAGSFAGMTGLACALMIVIANICAMDELSSIYTSPIIPIDRSRIADVLAPKSRRQKAGQI